MKQSIFSFPVSTELVLWAGEARREERTILAVVFSQIVALAQEERANAHFTEETRGRGRRRRARGGISSESDSGAGANGASRR